MIIPAVILENFVEKVPSCTETDSGVMIGTIFQTHHCDRVVVVDQLGSPLRVLYLSEFLSCLQEQDIRNWFSGSLKVRLPPGKPLLKIPADWTLQQWISYVGTQIAQDQTQSDFYQSAVIALTGKNGEFLGLLDGLALLKSMTLTFPASESSFSTADGLDLLVSIVEAFPFPLQLQTSTGQVLAQNQAWSSQLGNPPFSPRDWFSSPTPSPTQETSRGDCSVSSLEVSVACAIANYQGGKWEFSPFLPGEHPSLIFNTPEPKICHSFPSDHHSGDSDITDSEITKVWQIRFYPLDLQTFSPPDQPQSQSSIPLRLVWAEDITQHEALMTELAAKNADLIKVNRIKDEFLACISHELKTPLTAILGLSSLLQEKLLGELSSRQARYAYLIHHSGKQLMRVVNDILDLTRLETNQLELVLEPVDIRSVCEKVHHQVFQENLDPDDSFPEFTLEIEADLHLLIADEMRLRQILANLLSNALKFTDASGKVGLKVNRWNDWINFTVWDTGIGISGHQQHLLFQKFQQLESPMTRRFPGTGLGLVVSQRLAHLHGGDISFISAEGEGSEFTLLIPPCPPFKKEQLQEIKLYQQILIDQGVELTKTVDQPLILIVEKEPDLIKNLYTLLSQLQYRVLIARSGTEALEKARCFQPALIFLNPLLPLLSGWDVLTLLKTNRNTDKIRVVVTGTLADQERALLQRADDFLSLPVKVNSLELLLKQWLPRSGETPDLAPCQFTLLWLTPLFLSGDHWENSSNLLPVESYEHTDNSETLRRIQFISRFHLLEASDLDQADLIARIWKPQILILDQLHRGIDPVQFLQELYQYPHLASLSLVSLDPSIIEASHQIYGGMNVTDLSTQGTSPDQIAFILQEILDKSPHLTRFSG